MHIMLHKDHCKYQRTCIKYYILFKRMYASYINNDRQQKVGCTKNQGINE